MPQYNQPAAITTLSAADVVLIWQNAAAANKTITALNLATALLGMPGVAENTVTFYTSNQLLDQEDVVIANAGSPFTITVPAAVSYSGKVYRICNKGAGTITIQRSGADTIGGSISITLAQHAAVTLVSDGVSEWFQV